MAKDSDISKEEQENTQNQYIGPDRTHTQNLLALNVAMAEILGGEPVQGKDVNNPFKMAEAVRNQVLVLNEQGLLTEADVPEGFFNKFNTEQNLFNDPANTQILRQGLENARSRQTAELKIEEEPIATSPKIAQSGYSYEFDANILEAQSYLYMLGYAAKVDLVDGRRGPMTDAALAKYAEDFNYPLEDGQSIKDINSEDILAHLHTTASTPANQRLLLENAETIAADPTNTDAVLALQNTLNFLTDGENIRANGQFGPDTEAALDKYRVQINGAMTDGLIKQTNTEIKIDNDLNATVLQIDAKTGPDPKATTTANAHTEAREGDFALQGSLVIDDGIERHVKGQIADAYEKGVLSNSSSELADKSFLTVKNGTPFVARYIDGELEVRQVNPKSLQENGLSIDYHSVVMDPELVQKIANQASRQARNGVTPDGDTQIGRVDFDLDWQTDPSDPSKLVLANIELDADTMADRKPIKERYETVELTLSDGSRIAVDADDAQKAVRELSREFNAGATDAFGRPVGDFDGLKVTFDQVRDGTGGHLRNVFNRDSYGTSAEMNFANGETIKLPDSMANKFLDTLVENKAEMEVLDNKNKGPAVGQS